MSADSDHALVQAYLEGHQPSFSTLVSRYTDPIFAYVLRLTGDREAATDITQEVFIKAWKKLSTFNPEQNFKTWLYTIARNTAYDWLRKKKPVPFSVLEQPDGDGFEQTIVDSEPLPHERFEEAEGGMLLESLLAELSPDVRDILLLHYVDGMTFDEIGRIREESLNTVKSRHRRALLLLRKLADQHAPKRH
ncbi:MAG: sigma-70 family RNA polymerase sigma factor [Minisyncoccia bacterium]